MPAACDFDGDGHLGPATGQLAKNPQDDVSKTDARTFAPNLVTTLRTVVLDDTPRARIAPRTKMQIAPPRAPLRETASGCRQRPPGRSGGLVRRDRSGRRDPPGHLWHQARADEDKHPGKRRARPPQKQKGKNTEKHRQPNMQQTTADTVATPKASVAAKKQYFATVNRRLRDVRDGEHAQSGSPVTIISGPGAVLI